MNVFNIVNNFCLTLRPHKNYEVYLSENFVNNGPPHLRGPLFFVYCKSLFVIKSLQYESDQFPYQSV